MPHEIGHLLGLKHPWHGTRHGWDTDGRAVPESKQRTDTVMSYNSFGVSGWQEIDLRILKLIYGVAAGADGHNSQGHRPFAASQVTLARPETDLFDDRSIFTVELLNPTEDRTHFDDQGIHAKVFPDETGSKKLFEVKFTVAGDQVADSRLLPMVGGIFSPLYELRPTADRTVFSFYIRDVDKIPFYSSYLGWIGSFDFRFDGDIDLLLGPQFHPVRIKVHLQTAAEPDDISIGGRPVVGTQLFVSQYDDSRGYRNDIQSDASYEWRREGDDTILSTEAFFRPALPGNYTVKISFPDPQWRYTAVVERQIEVRAEHDPKQGHSVVRFEYESPINPNNPPDSEHNGTDAAEWFDIERPMKISGGGGKDIFARSNTIHGDVTITDFTRGEYKIWLYSMTSRPAIAFRHVDTDSDSVVDATLIGTAYKPWIGPATFTPFLVLENFTEELEETDFLLDGGDLLLARWPCIV